MRFCRASGGHRVPLGTPWGSEADCERLWGWLRHHFGACRLRFSIDSLEKCDFAISTPLSRGMAAFASPDTKLDAPAPKSRGDERSGRSKRAGRSKSDRQNTFCCTLRRGFASASYRNRKDFENQSMETSVFLILAALPYGMRVFRGSAPPTLRKMTSQGCFWHDIGAPETMFGSSFATFGSLFALFVTT